MLGLLRRNLYKCQPSVKEIAYNTLVSPKVEYCASVCDPYTTTNIDEFEMVQRRAARFVKSDYRREPGVVTERLSSLKWQSLAKRRMAARLTMMYKTVHGLVDSNTDVLLDEQATQIREGSLPSTYRRILARKAVYSESFFPRTVSECNTLPGELRAAASVDKFKSGLLHIDLGHLRQDSHHD